ncbi:MAG: ComF family protein [Bacteroidia bacterium]|nr:ComF family protein [Bacteroidia bacterium]
MRNWLADFFQLFYPNICAACGERLLTQEKVICTRCLVDLPRTNFHYEHDNPVSQLFWGRVNVQNATALFRFQKGSRFQDLLHLLKYNGRQDIGEELGRQLGFELKKSELFNSVNVVIPVPLHPKREKKRGYNQAECIAKGIADSMGIEIQSRNMVRSVETQTQTKKSRIERWQNLDSIFKIKKPEKLNNKHILLVDDVVTTGATLEACAQAILKTEGVKVNIAALATA